MIKRKILIVSGAFYPENSPRAIRTTELVKEFARQGHQVTLIIPDKTSERIAFEKEHQVSILDMGKRRLKPFKASGRGIVRLITRALVRFPTLLFEYPGIQLMWMVKKALKNESGYDMLISIAVPYPIHWGVAWARSAKHRIAEVWVADCGDPYFGRENDTFKVPFYFSYIEKWFCRKADYLSIPFEGAKKSYFSEFHSKIKIIPQGFTFPEKIKISNKNPIPKFLYAGDIMPYRHYALPFFELLKKIPTPFEFHVYTKTPEFYKEHLSILKDKIKINSYVNRVELLRTINTMDFLVHFPYKNPTQRSLKLIDYLFSEKPVLSFEASPSDNENFYDFLNGDFKNQYKSGDIEQYRIENVCQQFLQLLDEL